MPAVDIQHQEPQTTSVSNRLPEPKSHKLKTALIVGIVVLYLYPTPLYRLLVPFFSGTSATPVNQAPAEHIEEIKNASAFTLQRQNYTYNLLPRAKYELYGRIIDLERYSGLWERFAHDYDQGRMIYNALSPLDLVIGYEQMAEPAQIKQFKFKHEYRLMWWQPQTRLPNMTTLLSQFNNFHIIPATPRIALATKTLMRGDMVRLKGLLVDVTTPLFDWWKLTTGTGHHQYHKEFYGGQYATMCFVVYVQEIQIGKKIYK